MATTSPLLTPSLRKKDPYIDDPNTQNLNRALTGISSLSEQELIDLHNLYTQSSGSGKTFTSGGSTLKASGVTIDPRITALQQEGLGIAQKNLTDTQASRKALGTQEDFISGRTKGLRSGIEKAGTALTERLQKTGVEGEFGRQSQVNFAESAKQKLASGELMAIEEFNSLQGKFDLMEGGAAELLKSIDMTDFQQQMEARGLSQELTSKLTRLAQGKDAISDAKSEQNKQMAGNLVMAMAMFSDRRLKRNIKKIGEFNGFNIYSYIYLWGEKAVGVIAQEVMRVMPEAVLKHKSGFYMVDYSKVLEVEDVSYI